MNKTEKLICLLLGGVLAWYIFAHAGKKPDNPTVAEQIAAQTNAAPASVSSAPAPVPAAPSPAPASVKPVQPSVPEKSLTLENDQLKLTLSTWGAVVKQAVLKGYARDCGEISTNNPAVSLEFDGSPLGAIVGSGSLPENAAYEVKSQTSNEIVFVRGAVMRKVTLGSDYQITYEDALTGDEGAHSLSLGVMRMGNSKNDLLSVDSLDARNAKGKEEVLHHCEGDSPLKEYLVGGLSGGCSGSSSAKGMPDTKTVEFHDEQKWIAVKNRFFVSALAAADNAIAGFDTTIARDLGSSNYRPASVAVKANFAAGIKSRKSVFYVGPKRQSLLWELGMRDVMEFGMWRWLCYPIVYLLNLFNDWVPNYGVAIILLTILVRLVFWPLTHKSTVGMKRMQELQPKMKEIQAKFKDNPQRLQQETWAMYREAKVNPMSSCLPMLIQIPVFIALFNVLRSAVELRYAPFLWISDLSEPEGLLAAYLPFGGLNLLPILMALTTGLQSALTPSSGDKNQQRMMMVFMPIMMLVMFYSFPSALSLYWFLSNLFSIVQMWVIRRQTASKSGALVPEVIDPPVTRQMRRHS